MNITKILFIMKKLFLSLVLVAFGYTANAQFNAGVNLGLPLGDSSDFSSFVVGAELNYLFDISEEFKVGPSVGYNHFFGKEVAGTKVNSSIIPIAAAARFNASEQFVLGADLGVGIGASNVEGSGFYYRPMVGYNVSDKLMLQLTYSGVTTDGGGSVSHIGLGGMFSL